MRLNDAVLKARFPFRVLACPTDLCGAASGTDHELLQRMTWKISNKYYEADVDVMTTRRTWQDLKLRDELKSVDGLVLAFDPTEVINNTLHFKQM